MVGVVGLVVIIGAGVVLWSELGWLYTLAPGLLLLWWLNYLISVRQRTLIERARRARRDSPPRPSVHSLSDEMED